MKNQLFQMANQNQREAGSMQTSLFDLIVALQDEVYVFEDWIILEVVLDLFETGQAKFVAAD